MSCSDLASRRLAGGGYLAAGLLLALAGAGLGGCGFKPLYGQDAVTRGLDDKSGLSLGGVEILNIPDRRGQELRNRLIDRFYAEQRPVTPRYQLKIVLSASVEKLGIQKDNSATRAELNMSAHYTLTDAVKHYTLTDGTSRTVVSYNFLTNDYATIASQNDAYERGLDDVADDLTQRVALALTRFQDNQKKEAAEPLPTLAPAGPAPSTPDRPGTTGAAPAP